MTFEARVYPEIRSYAQAGVPLIFFCPFGRMRSVQPLEINNGGFYEHGAM